MRLKKLLSGFVALCLSAAILSPLGGASLAADTWQEESAATRQRIEITNSTGTEFTDTPVLVRIDSTIISSSESIRFYAEDGDTELPFEIETWNPAGTSSVWVKVPVVAANGTTAIYGYYNGDKTATSPDDVWNDNFVLVEHFASAEIGTDSTGTNTGTLTGNLTTKDSTMGTAAVFTGSQKVTYEPLLSGEGAFTISAVVDTEDPGSYVGIATRDKNGGTKDGDTYFLGINGGSGQFLGRFYGTKANKDITTPYSAGYHVLTLSYTGSKLMLYIDGVMKASADIDGGTVDTVYGTPLVLGAYSDEDLMNALVGTFDDIQMSKIATSDDYETFRNANYRGTCVTAGPAESQNGELVFTVTTPSNGGTVETGDISVSGFLSKDAEISYALNEGEAVSAGSFEAGQYSFNIPVYDLGQQTLLIKAESTTDAEDAKEITVHFTMQDTIAPGEPILSDGSENGYLPLGDATLTAEVTQAEQESVNVDFYQQGTITLNSDNTVVRQGTSAASLPTALSPTSGTETNTLTPVTTGDNAVPYQIYTITLNDEQQAAESFHLTWKGSANREVGAYVYDHSQFGWTLLSTGSGDSTVLEMDIPNENVLKDGKLTILIWRGMNEPLSGRDSYIPEADEYDFNLMWTSDTQFYSQNESDTEVMTQQFNWVIDNFDALKSTMFIHTGDLVNVAEQEYQWKNISDAYELVEDAGIPYAVITGNHDLGNSDYYTKYFPVSRLSANNEYFMGTQDNNYFYTFEESGAKFLILCLDMKWGKSDIEWANNVLQQYPDHFGILLVHDYLKVDGSVELGSSYADVQMLHDDLVAVNDNIRLVLCGHNHGVNTNLEYFGDRAVYSVLADYQSLSRGGLGYMRMLKFDVENDLIYVNTYSPLEDKTEYFTDKQTDKTGLYQKNKDEFVIQTELGGDGTRTLATTGLTMTADTASPIGETVTVQGPGKAQVTWSGLAAGQTYSWYALLTDEAGNTTKTDLQTFTVLTDRTALDAVIKEAKAYTDLSGYTDQSAEAFTNALNAALAVGDGAAQSEIDRAASDLRDAIDGLTPKSHTHTVEKVDKTAPTCTDSGNIEYWHCLSCGKYFSDEALTEEISKDDTILSPTGHTIVHTEAKAPTKTEAGNIEYWHCEVCGRYFADEALTKEITKDATVLPATGNGNGNSGGNNNTNNGGNTPVTGDFSMILILAAVLIFAAAVLVVLLYRRKNVSEK